MAGKSDEEAPEMLALHTQVLARRKEILGEILRDYGLEEDLEKLCLRGIYRVQDIPPNLNDHIINKDKMRGSMQNYMDIYMEHEKKGLLPNVYVRHDTPKKGQGGKAVCGEAACGPVPKKEAMAEDMQGELAKCIFSGPPCMHTIDLGPEFNCRSYWRPGFRLRTIWEREPQLEKAALVCKTWNQKYQEHLAKSLPDVFKAVCERAVDLALNMCDIDEYVGMPTLSRVVYAARRGGLQNTPERCLFVMRFTRTGMNDGVRELHANYGIPESRTPKGSPACVGPALSPVRTIKLPEVCWIHGLDCADEQLQEFRQWRAEQTTALEQWLGEQHGVFYKSV